MKTDSNAMWLVSPDVRSTYSKDGAVLLDIRKGLCYGLNAVAAQIWATMEASQAGITLDGILTALEVQFTVHHRELEIDIIDCLHKLQRMGLVQSSS